MLQWTGSVSIPAFVAVTKSEVDVGSVPQARLPFPAASTGSCLCRVSPGAVPAPAVMSGSLCSSPNCGFHSGLWLWVPAARGSAVTLLSWPFPASPLQVGSTSSPVTEIRQRVSQSPRTLLRASPLQSYLKLARGICGREQHRKYQAL